MRLMMVQFASVLVAATALPVPICVVVKPRTKPQMGRIAARRIVTTGAIVQHTKVIGDWPESKFVGETVGFDQPARSVAATANDESAVTVKRFPACEDVALAGTHKLAEKTGSRIACFLRDVAHDVLLRLPTPNAVAWAAVLCKQGGLAATTSAKLDELLARWGKLLTHLSLLCSDANPRRVQPRGGFLLPNYTIGKA